LQLKLKLAKVGDYFLAFIYSLYTITVILCKNTGLLLSSLRNNYAPFNTQTTADF
jgi:hypothetical protein